MHAFVQTHTHTFAMGYYVSCVLVVKLCPTGLPGGSNGNPWQHDIQTGP